MLLMILVVLQLLLLMPITLNRNSDSELMLSLLADELLKQPPTQASGSDAERRILGADNVFAAVRGLMQRARGGYACVMLVAGHGIVAFRDPCEYSLYTICTNCCCA
jgi:glutamine phosphoribosylpyrophosphate amidotransferase